jgi:hypothetical protein
VTKPQVLLRLEDSNISLAMTEAGTLFGPAPLGYIPWYLWDGEKSYDFGFSLIRSAPVTDVLKWRFFSSTESNPMRRSRAYRGTCEWMSEDKSLVTIKWMIRHGPIASVEKLEAWIRHWAFKTWLNDNDDEKISKAAEIGRWYWNVRKDPGIIHQLVEKAHEKCSKPQRSVAEAMEVHRDRFHEAHKWDWFYQGCPTESLPDQFTEFKAYGSVDSAAALNVPGVGPVTLRPDKWVSVPPFKVCTTLPIPIMDDDDEVTNALLRVPTTRPK